MKIEITKEIGTCLITGIITDTGGFKYSNVNSDTFWLLQLDCLEKGINISDIYEKGNANSNIIKIQSYQNCYR